MDTLQTQNAEPRTLFEEEVAGLGPWFHNLHLPEGETAPDHPLGDFPNFKWKAIGARLPEDLAGWSALDVGCNAGFYSFALARRGAQLQAIDVDERYLRQARWAAGKQGLESRVRFSRRSVYEEALRPERYDLVWFMGVFYHLRYPVLALDLLARKAKRLFVFQSLSRPQREAAFEVPDNLRFDQREQLADPAWPAMSFVENRFAGDPTNWWVASPAALEALLRTAGLRIREKPDEETFICQPDPRQEPHEGRELAAEELEAVLAAIAGAR